MALDINFKVKNGLVVATTATVSGNYNSVSTQTGGLIVTGGAGIGRDLYVGGTIYGNISGTLVGNAATVSAVQQTNTLTHFLTFVDTNNTNATAESIYTTSSFAIIPSSGNVGIGTANPGSKLHVEGSDTTVYSATNQTISSSDILRIYNTDQTTTGYTGIYLQHKNSDVAMARIALYGSFFDSNTAALTFGLRPMSGGGRTVERMRITAEGNIGIGTTSPTDRLHVSNNGGTAQIRIGDTSTSQVGLILQRRNTGIDTETHWYNAQENSPWYLFGQNLIWNGERTGTVTSTHAYRPYYEAYSPIVSYKEFGFVNVTSGTFTGSNLIANLVLKNDGNVGINNKNPQASLDVAGGTRISGITTVTNTTNATSTTTGALQISGGASISGDLYVFKSINVGIGTIVGVGLQLNNSNIAGVNALSFNDPGPNEGLEWAGGNWKIYESPDDLVTNASGNLQFVANDIRRVTFNTNGQVSITTTTNATSTTTGALVVAGGAGIGGNLYVGGEIVAQKITIQLTTITTTLVETDDIIKTINTTQATSTVSGALQVAGGAGIGKDLWVGGTIYGNISGTVTGSASQVNTVQRTSTLTHFLTFVDANNVTSVGENLYTTSSFSIIPDTGTVNIGGNLFVNANIPQGTDPSITSNPGIQSPIYRNAVYSASTSLSYAQSAVSLVLTNNAASDGVSINNFVMMGLSARNDGGFNSQAFFGAISSPEAGGDFGRGAILVWGRRSGGTYVESMRITRTGDLAIGTTTTTAKLEVAGGSRISGITIINDPTNSTSTNTGALQVVGGAGIGQDLRVGGTIFGNVTGNLTGVSTQVNTIQRTTNASHYITFVDSNNTSSTGEILYTTGSLVVNPGTGNVGIGTTNPAGILDIVSYPTISSQARALAATTLNGDDTFGIIGIASRNSGNPDVQIGVYGSGRAAISGRSIGGYFSLETTEDTSIPSFSRTTSSIAALIANNGGMTDDIFQALDNGVVAFSIKDGGNVGIGTSTATTRLDVVGGTRISGVTTITNTTSAVSTTTGALQVAGGASVGGNLFVHGNVNVGTANTSSSITTFNTTTSALDVQSIARFISPNNANTLTTRMLNGGALSVEGSSGQLFSIIDSFTGTIFSVNDISGIPSIEVFDTGEVRMAQYNGFVDVMSNTQSTSTNSGAFQVVGGVGIGGNLFVGGLTNISGVTTVTNTTSATSTLTGALRVAGGVGVGQDLWVGGTIYGNISGTVTGSASQVNTIQRTTSATHYLTFVDSNNVSSTGELLYTNNTFVLNPSTGNFGVGTTDPNNKLTVINSSNTSGFYLKSSSPDIGASHVAARIIANTGQSNQTTTALAIADGDTAGASEATFTGVNVTANSRNTAIGVDVTITKNWGGASLGGSAIGVRGSGSTDSAIGTAYGGYFIGASNSGTTYGLYVDVTGSGTRIPFAVAANGSERFRITSAGDVGIGTNNPGGALVVNSGATLLGGNTNYGGRLQVYADASYILRGMSSGGSDLASIDNLGNIRTISGSLAVNSNTLPSNAIAFFNGNVAIGITTASTRLEVSGGTRISGITTVTNTTTATSTTTGALQVVGGTGIGGNLYVGGTSNLSGITSITNNTGSTGTTSGALQVTGGAGIGQDLYVGAGLFTAGDAKLGNTRIYNVTRTLTTATGDAVEIGSLTSNNGSSNAIIEICETGAGQSSAKTYFCRINYDDGNDGNWRELLPLYSTGPRGGDYTVDFRGNVGIPVLRVRRTAATIYGNITLTITIITYNNITFTSSSAASTSTSVTGIYQHTQLTQLAGNVGVGLSNPSAKLHVSGTTRISGVTNLTDTTNATSTATGALQVTGGVGVGGNLYVGGEIVAQKLTIQLTTVTTTLIQTDDIIQTYNTSNATSTTTGALQVSGGAGIGRDLYVGGTIYGNISGTVTGSASQVNTIQRSTTATHFITFVDSNNVSSTGELVYTTSSISVNPGSINLTVGNLSLSGSGNPVLETTGAWGTSLTLRSLTGDSAVNIVGTASGSNPLGIRLYVGSTASSSVITIFDGNSTAKIAIDPNNNTISASQALWNGGTLIWSGANGAANVNAGHILIRGGNAGDNASFSSSGGDVYIRGGAKNALGAGSMGNVVITQPDTTTIARFDSATGFVGIRNNSPTTALDVTGGTRISGVTTVTNTTAATSTTTGSLQVAGGAGIGGNLYVGNNLHIGSGTSNSFQTYTETTINSTAATTISSASTSTFRSARYQVQITQGTDFQVADILAVHNNTTATFIEYGNISTGNSLLGTFNVTVNGGNMLLQVTMNSNTTATAKVHRFAMGV